MILDRAVIEINPSVQCFTVAEHDRFDRPPVFVRTRVDNGALLVAVESRQGHFRIVGSEYVANDSIGFVIGLYDARVFSKVK